RTRTQGNHLPAAGTIVGRPAPPAGWVGPHVALAWAVACGAPAGAQAMVQPAALPAPAEPISGHCPAGNPPAPGRPATQAPRGGALGSPRARARATDPHQ